jgi:hypothetical protein
MKNEFADHLTILYQLQMLLSAKGDLKKTTPLQKKGHNYRLMSEINVEYSSFTLLFNYGSH